MMDKAEREKLRKAAQVIYLCVDEETAKSISELFTKAADHIDALERQIADKVAWLVEDAHTDGVIRYRTMDQTGIHWTADVNQAIRFSRREDAEMFAAGDEDAFHICEHMWCAPKAAIASAQEGKNAEHG
jgi:hypothetical protein